jgi:antitoxin component of MazEF toxin-antitoxin module
MRKKLSTLGNSVALVIEKPLCRMLGIGPGTTVEVSFDGPRIVIEPIRPDIVAREQPERDLTADAERVFNELMHDPGWSQETFERLHCGSRRMTAYSGWVYTRAWENGVEHEINNMRRMRECWRARRAGKGWDEAIEIALRAFPKPEAQ